MTLCNDIFIQGDGGRKIAMLVKQSDGTANLTVNEFSKIERAIVQLESLDGAVSGVVVAGSGAISGNNIALSYYASGNATATSGGGASGRYIHVLAAGK